MPLYHSNYANDSEKEFISDGLGEFIIVNRPRDIARMIGNIMERIWRDYSKFL